MSNGTRVVFMRFARRDSPKLEPWREHCRRVVGQFPEFIDGTSVESDGGTVAWNLVSANNRMLARGAALYAQLEDAVADATRLTEASGAVEIRLVAERARGLYGWHGAVDGVPALTCARWYLNERDRRSSIELALLSLSTAALRPGVRAVHPGLNGLGR